MKIGKKLLSILLSLLMIVGCISVSFSSLVAYAATPTVSEIKTALANASSLTDLTNGDGSLLKAAELIYSYVSSIAVKSTNSLGGSYDSPSLSVKSNNSVNNLNATLKSALGSTAYNSVINSLLPTSGVYDDSSYTSDSCYNSGSYSGVNASWNPGKVSYKLSDTAKTTSTVTANLEKVLLSYGSLSDVPTSILLSATYSYDHSVKQGEVHKSSGNFFSKKWSWKSYSWHYLTSVTRSDVKTNTKAYTDLHAFANYFTASLLGKSLYDLSCMSTEEINAVIAANNNAYARLNDYSANVKKHFFDMSAVDKFMANCLYAQKVINAKPAITSLNSAMAAGYDTEDLSAMNDIYTAQHPYIDFLTTVNDSDATVIPYVAANFAGYDTFSLDAAKAFIVQLDKDIQLYKLRQLKSQVDAIYAQYPDAETIAAISDADDNLALWTYYDVTSGYYNSVTTDFTPAYVNEVFTEGTAYIAQLRDMFKYEYDYRGAEKQYESYYSWFLPLIYADLTQYETQQIIGTGIAENIPNIANAKAKLSAFNNMYSSYEALIGSASMQVIFGTGEESLKYIIEDYISRLYDVILARLTSEVEVAVGYYDAYGEVNLNNFVTVKEAIGRVESDIWDYLNANNSAIISSKLRNDYNRLSSLLSLYENFVATGGLDGFRQQHLHGADGIYVTREAMEADEARKADENYDVTVALVSETIKKLDAFLTSNDFATLVDIDGDDDRELVLSDFIKEILAENLYTNKFVNMLMNIIYPALVDALEDLYASLPASVSVDVFGSLNLTYKSLRNIINDLGIGLYPDQVAPYIASSFGTAKDQLASATTWKGLLDSDGDLTLDWGIDSIVPENYGSTESYLAAKKAKFLGAMAESFDAILPIVRVLVADWDGLNLKCNKAGTASKTVLGMKISLNGDLTLTANGCAAYSDFIVPVLEALGCSGIKNYDTVKGYTESRQFIDAIFNPLIDFVENTLAKKPVETICKILPNLAYAISFDKVWALLDNLNIDLHYLVEDSILSINVLKDTYSLKCNELISKDSLNLGFDISSFSSIVGYVLGMFVDGFDTTTLPIINAGELVTYASVNTNASTLRHTGKRTNFTADKEDVFMDVLKYLVECLGNDDFVSGILAAFSKDGSGEISDELRTIIDNARNDPDMAVAAIIELLNQTRYRLDDYTWYDGSVGGTVEGLTPAALVYLSHTNDWTKATADYAYENLNDIVNGIIATAGSDVELSKVITDGINSIFTNSTLTDLAKLLSGASSLATKLNDIISGELGVDLTDFAVYADLPDDYSWGFADGDRDGFINALIRILSPLQPIYGFLFTGEDIHLFEDSANNDILTFYGSEGYDTAIVPLFEALGCEVTSVADYKAAVAADSSAALRIIFDSLANKLDEIGADPLYSILDTLPGLLYFITSNGLSTAISNLLHPVFVILDTIRPVFPIDVDGLINETDAISELDITIDTDKLNLDFIVELVEKLTGLKIDKLKTIVEDVSIVIATEYTSASSFAGTAYKGAYVDDTFDGADMITVILSSLIEVLGVDGNAAAFDKLIGTDGFTRALLSLFKGTDPETKTINWMYYFGDDADLTAMDFETGIIIEPTINAITYPNNWTEASADYLNTNLDSVVSLIVGLVDEDYDDLASLIDDKLDIYTSANVEAVAKLLDGIFNGVNEDLIKAAGVAFSIDLTAWKDYTAPAGIDTAEEFAQALTELLNPVKSLLDWLLFGRDYAFFTGTELGTDGQYTYNDLITIKGAQGYLYGLVPVLEALGCENIPQADDDDVIYDFFMSVFNRLDAILADPANEVLAILPNVIYFINADGVTNCLYNALTAVYSLLESINALGANADVDDLLGFDSSDLSLKTIIGFIEDATKLDLTPVTEFFSGLCVGTIKSFKSLNGEYAYTMSYSDELDRKDMLTIIITAFVEVIDLGSNERTLRGLIGDDVYDAVLNVLNLRQFSMQEPSWLFTEFANTDKTFSAMDTSTLYSGFEYGMIYTREMAEYIADNIDEFIDNIIYLLGIQIDGVNVDDLKELLNQAVNGSVYTAENAQWLLDKILSFVAKVDELNGSEHIKALIKSSIGVDLDAWDDYTVPAFEDNRAMFTQAVCDILAPLSPVLKWALCNEDFSFFVDEEKKDLVTLLGAEGYAYGVIPLLEALGCENVLTPDQYYAAAKTDNSAMITNILNPLFNRIDVIMEAPADEILEMLPAVIYFVNSNGLDTCFKNALHAVYGILGAIEPLIKVDLYELINIRLDELTFDTIYKYLLDYISEKTGYELTALEGDALLELTVGKLVSFTSANGEKAYTMVYQSETAKTEMVTIIERLLISFIVTEDNRVKLIGILQDYFGMSDETAKYVSSLLNALASYTTTNRIGMEKALAAIYYVFYGADIAADKTASAIKDVNEKWKEILEKLNGSDDPNAVGLGTILGNFLDMTLDGIFDSEGLAPEGFIVMFQRIYELFYKIIQFLKNLFK